MHLFMPARPVFEEKLVFVHRGCDRQEFRLCPDEVVNQIFLFLVMALAVRHRLKPIALCVMSNHYHAILYDSEGNLPEFTRELHALSARAINDATGQHGRFWDDKQTNRIYLEDNEVVIDRTSYTMGNPVAAGAVEFGDQWQGIRACWSLDDALPSTIERPDFFKGGGAKGLPESIEVKFHRPPGFEDRTDEQLFEQIRESVLDYEQLAREERECDGKTRYMGPEACAKISVRFSPKNKHAIFAPIPRFIARTHSARKEAYETERQWIAEYEDARLQWPTDRSVVFPHGTYNMRLLHGVSTAAPPGQAASAS
jgi:REP element-mobilizing transposase RayT